MFTDEQLANLSAVTWLYRGEHAKFVDLLAQYQNKAAQKLAALPEHLKADKETVEKLHTVLNELAKQTEEQGVVAAVREKLGEEQSLTDELLADYRTAVQALQTEHDQTQTTLIETLNTAAAIRDGIQALTADAGFEARHKASLKLLDTAEKSLRARQWAGFDSDTAREAKKALLPRDIKKREKPTTRDQIVETCKRASYYITQAHWLLSRFPQGVYEDVPGLCKSVTQDEIAANDYSLTPGRYVGVALTAEDDDDGEAFRARMMEIHSELAELNEKAAGLAASIQVGFAEMFE